MYQQALEKARDEDWFAARAAFEELVAACPYFSKVGDHSKTLALGADLPIWDEQAAEHCWTGVELGCLPCVAGLGVLRSDGEAHL